MRLYTIGFTKTPAAEFFGKLKEAGARRLVDVRLHNSSQLAGYAKRDDLAYFARAICGIDYHHRRELAPTATLFDAYKKAGGPWTAFRQGYTKLIAERRIETLDQAELDGACLLCSEREPHHCHRRLVAEYLQENWNGVEIVHL